ncbi:MAG: SsrA-binding protein SmpB [Patescibacteria group bacterium]
MSVFAENKKAFFDYEILDKFESGIVLFGFEVKAARAGRADLTESYIKIRSDNRAVLINAKIYPLQPLNVYQDYKINRTRQLLLAKKEIKNLLGKIQEKRLTAVPLKLYNKKNLIKLEFGLAKSKRRFEKREQLRKKAVEREIERTLTSKP